MKLSLNGLKIKKEMFLLSKGGFRSSFTLWGFMLDLQRLIDTLFSTGSGIGAR